MTDDLRKIYLGVLNLIRRIRRIYTPETLYMRAHTHGGLFREKSSVILRQIQNEPKSLRRSSVNAP
jgi:hypothetical protein